MPSNSNTYTRVLATTKVSQLATTQLHTYSIYCMYPTTHHQTADYATPQIVLHGRCSLPHHLTSRCTKHDLHSTLSLLSHVSHTPMWSSQVPKRRHTSHYRTFIYLQIPMYLSQLQLSVSFPSLHTVLELHTIEQASLFPAGRYTTAPAMF